MLIGKWLAVLICIAESPRLGHNAPILRTLYAHFWHHGRDLVHDLAPHRRQA
jgi:hypothetical protein